MKEGIAAMTPEEKVKLLDGLSAPSYDPGDRYGSCASHVDKRLAGPQDQAFRGRDVCRAASTWWTHGCQRDRRSRARFWT